MLGTAEAMKEGGHGVAAEAGREREWQQRERVATEGEGVAAEGEGVAAEREREWQQREREWQQREREWQQRKGREQQREREGHERKGSRGSEGGQGKRGRAKTPTETAGSRQTENNITDVSNFSDSCLYYFLTSNYIVQSVHLNISCSNYTDSTQSYHT